MGKDILTFDDIEFEKKKNYHGKSPIFSEDVDIAKILVSNKMSSIEKKL